MSENKPCMCGRPECQAPARAAELLRSAKAAEEGINAVLQDNGRLLPIPPGERLALALAGAILENLGLAITGAFATSERDHQAREMFARSGVTDPTPAP